MRSPGKNGIFGLLPKKEFSAAVHIILEKGEVDVNKISDCFFGCYGAPY